MKHETFKHYAIPILIVFGGLSFLSALLHIVTIFFLSILPVLGVVVFYFLWFCLLSIKSLPIDTDFQKAIDHPERTVGTRGLLEQTIVGIPGFMEFISVAFFASETSWLYWNACRLSDRMLFGLAALTSFLLIISIGKSVRILGSH